LGPGLKAGAVRLNKNDNRFTEENADQAYIVNTDFDLTKNADLEIVLVPAPEIYLIPSDSNPGDANNDLKVLYQEHSGNDLITFVEGKGGQEYSLGVRNANLIQQVTGGELTGDTIKIKFDNKEGSDFQKKEIRIKTLVP
jgi:hypothetical protein